MDWAKTTARRDEKHLALGIWCSIYYRFDGKSLQTVAEIFTDRGINLILVFESLWTRLGADFVPVAYQNQYSQYYQSHQQQNSNDYPWNRPAVQTWKETWWRHQMETFSALLAICAGNSPVPGEFPAQRAGDAELWCFLWSVPERTVE